MTTITISREIGASGTYIALKLASNLGGTCFDQQVINGIALKMNKGKEQIEPFDQKTYSRIKVFFQEALDSIASGGMLFHPFGIGPIDWESPDIFSTYPNRLFQQKDYCEVLTQVVKELASQPNSVILGRGGCHILRGKPNVLNVRIVADRQDRLEQLMKEQRIDEIKAQKLLKGKDAAARNFIFDFFEKDIHDSHSYDVVLNTSRISPDNCIEIILSMANMVKKGL